MSAKEENMKYKLEFHPNPDCLSIHITKRLVKSGCQRFESSTDKIDIWDNNMVVGQKDPPAFVTRLFEVEGIKTVHIDQYEIDLEKGSVFEWNDMLERIISILNIELFPDDEPQQIGDPKKPTAAFLKVLRKQGCDV